MKILFTCSCMRARMKSSVAMLKPVKVMMNVRSSRPEVFLKILQNSQENTCEFKKGTMAQVFSCEFFEISKNTFFYRIPPVAVSGMCKMPGKLQWRWKVVMLSSMSSIVPWRLFFMSNLSHPVLLLDYINRLY